MVDCLGDHLCLDSLDFPLQSFLFLFEEFLLDVARSGLDGQNRQLQVLELLDLQLVPEPLVRLDHDMHLICLIFGDHHLAETAVPDLHLVAL